MSTPSYRDPNASIEDRVEHLLALMTLDEKLAQLSCLWSTSFVSTGTFGPNAVAEEPAATIYAETPLNLAHQARYYMNDERYTPVIELLKQYGAVDEHWTRA